MALSRYCIDTSAYSHFKRGDPDVVDAIDSAEWLGIPAVVIGELWLGFVAGSRKASNIAEFDRFLSNPAVHEIVVDRHIARVYAEILAALRAAGTPVPTNDIWIAACAASSGAAVLTYDAHYRCIQRVGVQLLPTKS